VGGHRSRHLAGSLVGVDVVGGALAVGSHGGDHRHVVLGDVVDHVDVDLLYLPDEADVLSVLDRPDLEERPVLAAQPDRLLSVPVESHEDVGVDLPEQDHLRHLDRLGVGDAQPLDETHLQAQPLHVVSDLRAAPVDDHRVHPDVLEQDDVPGEGLPQLLVAHRRPAVLDHDRAPVELPDVGQGLEEGLDRRGHVVYSALIRM
jgi:hypothetical protein